MPKAAKYLLIGSTEPNSGKSAMVLGLAHQFQQRGVKIAYSKPLGTCWDEPLLKDQEADVQFISETLKLSTDQVLPVILALKEAAIQRRVQGEDTTDYQQQLLQSTQVKDADLVLLEGPANLEEGTLFDLSLPQIAECLDAPVLLVARFHSLLIVGALLSAKKRLGDRLLGVVINDIPENRIDEVKETVQPFLEQHHIPILGLLPGNALLRSVAVSELVKLLNAEVLCRPDRLDLMVESLSIGAMNVNSALKYFRKGRNMAVVTGGDRADIQLAALETSTQCLILTGHMPPSQAVISRAEDLEIPILSVDLDTLTTVEIVDHAFGHVRVHEPIKVQCMYQLMETHFDTERLLADLNLQPAAIP